MEAVVVYDVGSGAHDATDVKGGLERLPTGGSGDAAAATLQLQQLQLGAPAAAAGAAELGATEFFGFLAHRVCAQVS